MPMHNSHTHCQATPANAQTQAWQRVCLHQRTTTLTYKTADEKEHRSDNMRLASCGVKFLNSSSVFQINFSAGLTVLCSEIPHERQAPKRYAPLIRRSAFRTRATYSMNTHSTISFYSSS